MPGKPKLHYFAARGRGELIRLLFAATGTEYEDIRYPIEEWPQHKKNTPAGFMPYVESASEKSVMVQSGAIARYYARKANLMGANDWEYYLVERALLQIDDAFLECVKIMFAPDDKKPELIKEFQTNKGLQLLTMLSKFAKESGTGFYVGKAITLADLASVMLLDNLASMPEFLAKFPDLEAHKKKVLQSNAKVANWIKTRPQTPI